MQMLRASALFVLASAAFAQTTARIVGTVTDPTGAVVAGAAVTVHQEATGYTRGVTTNEHGLYVAPALPLGPYTVTAGMQGFKKKSRAGIVLQVDSEARIDLSLEVGETTETVQVTGEAALLQTENSSVGQVIDQRYTSQIPLNGRDFTQLILLSPGAVSRPGAAEFGAGASTGSLGSGASIGGRDAHNNFMMDGASNNSRQFGSIAIKPSIDAIQEFKVQSNMYSSEYGQAAFGQVHLVTRSGTNQLHGTVFEFLRNEKFDARNFFLPKVSRLNRNQFGGTVGGPIRRDKTFYFFNYEGTRERRGVESFRSTPVQAWRDGDFSYLTSALRDPLGTAPFAGNRIPSTRFNKTALASLPLWAKQNYGAANAITNNLLVTRPFQATDDQITIKADHELTSNDRVSGRYSRAKRKEIATGALPGFETINPPFNHVASLRYNRTFNPRLLFEYQAAFSRSVFRAVSPNTGKVGFYSQFGINHQLVGSQFEGAPTYTFTGIALTTFGDGDFIPNNDISNEFTHTASLTRIHGNHTVKAGLSLTKYQQNTPGAVPGFRRGNFAFRGDFTGQAFADFMLGTVYSSQRVVGSGVETGRSSWWAGFINDDWKISPRLTLNLGLRYEYISPLADVRDRRSVFHPLSNQIGTGQPGQIIVANSAEASRLLGLDGIGSRALYGPDRNNLGPRIGFAHTWNPRTVLRGGYGIFYTNSQNFVNNFVINRRQPPYAETQQKFSSTTRPEIDLSNPFLGAGAPPVIATQNISPNFREGYVQQWNFTVQRELPLGITLDAGYVGNKGTKLTELPYYNIPLPQAAGDTRALQNRRPFPLWGTALSMESYVLSNYHSLQVKGQRRFSQGLSLLTAYTWSRSIDLSSERGNGDRGGLDGGDPRNLHGWYRGLSGFDVRHRLVVSYVYELPFGKGRRFGSNWNTLADRILGRWELSGITQAQAGFPFTVLMSGDQNGDGLAGDRPDLIGKPVVNTRNPNCYLSDPRNAACGTGVTPVFAAVPAAQARYGSEGRNVIIGPGTMTWDAGMSKNLPLTERFRLQFRGEFFNLLNRANFGGVDRSWNLTAPVFGGIRTAGRAREMQFGLKLEY